MSTSPPARSRRRDLVDNPCRPSHRRDLNRWQPRRLILQSPPMTVPPPRLRVTSPSAVTQVLTDESYTRSRQRGPHPTSLSRLYPKSLTTAATYPHHLHHRRHNATSPASVPRRRLSSSLHPNHRRGERFIGFAFEINPKPILFSTG